ncbi:TcpQ domain-containing protein [Pseudomonas sp. LW8]|uniref:TcpQ domain-containing protein n=1 Tax=Pseudomonas sp. LW8 TaxID=3242677 RepID=UPI0035C244FE
MIKTWSQRANYEVAWDAEDLDYPIDAPLRFEGSYEEAVAGIFQLYEKAERSFVVDGRRAQHRLNVSENSVKSKSKRAP